MEIKALTVAQLRMAAIPCEHCSAEVSLPPGAGKNETENGAVGRGANTGRGIRGRRWRLAIERGSAAGNGNAGSFLGAWERIRVRNP